MRFSQAAGRHAQSMLMAIRYVHVPVHLGALGSTSACLPGLKPFSFVSLCSIATVWDRSSHQPGWLDRCNP